MTTEYLLNREVGHILAALTPQNALIMETVLQTGLRISDVLELRTEQLWLSMWVREKKTGKMHRCGLPKDLLAAILAQAGEVWAFPGTKPGTRGVEGREAGGQGVPAAAEHRDTQLPQGLRRAAAGEVRQHCQGPAGAGPQLSGGDGGLRHGGRAAQRQPAAPGAAAGPAADGRNVNFWLTNRSVALYTEGVNPLHLFRRG